MAFVEVRNLRVRYGKFEAVQGISFDIPKGEVFGFIGPNGAGKSSTIKVLATLLAPSGGTVTMDGLSIPSHPRQIRRRIGYMPDFFGVYEDLTVEEYLHFFAAAYRLTGERRRQAVNDVLELTDLGHKREALVDSLSRGMKQRLGLARVLLHDPELLLLDEPASGLDPRARIEIRELLKELQRLGKTILISSHILHELAQLCTRVGIIEAGRFVAEGSVQEIYAKLGVRRIVKAQVTNLSEELIAGLSGLTGVESVQREADGLAIALHEDVLGVEELLLKLQGLGARVRAFQPEVMDMETAFMRLTEGKTA